MFCSWDERISYPNSIGHCAL